MQAPGLKNAEDIPPDALELEWRPREGVRECAGPAWLPGGTWFEADPGGGWFDATVPAGGVSRFAWLTLDLICDTLIQAKHTFRLELEESATGRVYQATFAALPCAQARLRLSFEAFRQNRLWLPREGALIRPSSRGDRVDPARIDRVRLRVSRIGEPVGPLRWILTPLRFQRGEPARLRHPRLPRGSLLDSFGQFRLREWPAKVPSEPVLRERLNRQKDSVDADPAPAGWGGWRERRVEATGVFHTHHDGRRWWLVDPDGGLFWSAGLDCVGPPRSMPVRGLETACDWFPPRSGPFAAAWAADPRTPENEPAVNFLVANLVRGFGNEWRSAWERVAVAELRRLGFNTFGNWSDVALARAARFPFVVELPYADLNCPTVYRDFPDVFSRKFEVEADRLAASLRTYADEPALIGYFLQNEAHWSFAKETPAAGVLYNAPPGATRTELASFLNTRYGGSEGFRRAWGVRAGLDEIATRPWRGVLPPEAEADLCAFSEHMVDRFYGVLSRACREVLPRHLNLGSRFPGIPPAWTFRGMRHVDVFSLNLYRKRVGESVEAVSRTLGKPVLIGEWHFGSLEAGLPGVANQNVRSESDRQLAYRVYLETAAACPGCVGAHYFRMYDNPALGRHDGENYSIGFFDTCNQVYPEMRRVAESHAAVYDLAAGTRAPMTPPDSCRLYLGI